MSNSPYQDTVFILDFLTRLNPSSVLDVGSGFGRWGFLCRCHLGVGESVVSNPSQDMKIEAIEAYPENVNSVYDAVYDKVHKGDAKLILPKLPKYDVIICSHIIEHFEKTDGWAFIEEAVRHANIAVIIGLPFRDPLRETPNKNAYEAHLSSWTGKDFCGRNVLVRTFSFKKEVDAGVVVFPVSENARWWVKTLRNPCRLFVAEKLSGLVKMVCRLFSGGVFRKTCVKDVNGDKSL